MLSIEFFIACMLLCLEYLHKNAILHRDIKPENLVFDENGYLRVTDLGIARLWQPENSKDTSGTPGYMAPEVIKNEHYTFSPDYFGLGCLIYEMIEGTLPFPVKKQKVKTVDAKKQLYIDALEKDEAYSEKFSKPASELRD